MTTVVQPRPVREERAPGAVPLYSHAEWTERFPWLVQGTTGRGAAEPYDLGMFGEQPIGAALARWRSLQSALGMPRAVHAAQAHGTDVRAHEDASPGLLIIHAVDGHVTRTPGILLAVSVADCVPVFAVDPERRAVAALHAGWRGVAGRMLRAGIAALGELAGSAPADLHVHLGPAICGACYEVGPEVHAALGLATPEQSTPVDLRAVLARQASQLGVSAENVTVSELCTRCGESPFFSHRAGARGRQMGLIGIRVART